MALYFAYASCMNEQSLARSGVQAKFLGTATLRHYRLAFTRYSRKSGGGVADVVPSTGAVVLGVLYEVPNFKALDKREGVPYTYRRKKVRVYPHAGQDSRIAWIYEVVHKSPIEYTPSPAYARVIWNGAIVLPDWYRQQLRRKLHLTFTPNSNGDFPFHKGRSFLCLIEIEIYTSSANACNIFLECYNVLVLNFCKTSEKARE